MPLDVGNVKVNPDGSSVATGLAKSIYDAFVDNYLEDTTVPMPVGAASVPVKTNIATQANRLSTAIITYFVANAEVDVTTLMPQGNPTSPNCSAGGVIAGVNSGAHGTGTIA